MRYVALAALVVLVGAYVVGQELPPEPPIKSESPTLIDKDARGTVFRAYRVDDDSAQSGPPSVRVDELLDRVLLDANFAASQVARYLPFGDNRLVDTVTGTLYRIEGDAWVEAVKMRESKPDQSTSMHHRVLDSLVEEGCEVEARAWSGKSGKQYTFGVHAGCPSVKSIELIKQWADLPAEGVRLKMMMVDSSDFTPEAESALDAIFKHKDKIGTKARLYSNSPLPKQPGAN